MKKFLDETHHESLPPLLDGTEPLFNFPRRGCLPKSKQANAFEIQPEYQSELVHNKPFTLDPNLPLILSTPEAARLLRRKPNTLRKWACFDSGPIKPIRIGNRLQWKTADIARLLNEPA